ncbi:MAG: 30S ribosomal protein S6--L-glutamate ligase [Legionellaceae bacterium]|nr:30S ribosomal protein S6--L-glutamate ligase [Legionellaceae bacterium]
MNIAILSREQSLYSTKRLHEAALDRDHEVSLIDYTRTYMDITSERGVPGLHSHGKSFSKFDAIIPRIGASRTFYGTSVLRQFETAGIYTINPSISITRSRDKLRCLQLLAMKGVEMPVTGFAHSPKDIKHLIERVGGPPLVIKLIEGTQGAGVILVETKKAAESVIEAFMGLKANIIVQEFIGESKGSDIRCFVLGDKVVASMCRRADDPNEFRSNLHQGGKGEVVKITPAERAIAVKAVKTLGMKMAGVDMLRSNRGPLIMEVNSSPGLEGIEKTTGKDIAGMVIRFLEKDVKLARGQRRYQG